MTDMFELIEALNARDAAAAAAAAPAPKPAVHTHPADQNDPFYARRAAAWAPAALAGVAHTLAAMPPDSGRNAYLSAQTWRFLRYAHAGHIPPGDVLDTMRDAAHTAGLGYDEIDGTLRSAITGADKDGPSNPELRDTAPEAPAAPTAEAFAETPPENNPETEAHETPHEKTRRILPELDWHALWANEDEEEWIVDPILPARRLVALYSAPKLGKSLLMLEIAVGVATGGIVLGSQVDRKRHVLYIDFENDPKTDIRQRLQDMGRTPDELTHLHYLSFPNMAALDSEKGGVELMAAIDAYTCEVVVVDTVSRAIAGDENENDTWLDFYRHTGLKLKQAGVSLVRLDHSGKDETKGQRGGSAKSGDVDAVWRLSRVKDDTYRLDCEAARMPVAEKVLIIHRELHPLRHRVEGGGAATAGRIKIEAAIKALDDLGLPNDIGRDKAAQALRAAGGEAGTWALSKAVAERKKRLENLSQDGQDRSV